MLKSLLKQKLSLEVRLFLFPSSFHLTERPCFSHRVYIFKIRDGCTLGWLSEQNKSKRATVEISCPISRSQVVSLVKCVIEKPNWALSFTLKATKTTILNSEQASVREQEDQSST